MKTRTKFQLQAPTFSAEKEWEIPSEVGQICPPPYFERVDVIFQRGWRKKRIRFWADSEKLEILPKNVQIGQKCPTS